MTRTGMMLDCPQCITGFTVTGTDHYGSYRRCMNCGWVGDCIDVEEQMYRKRSDRRTYAGRSAGATVKGIQRWF